jgi:hypothetical protein
MGQRFVPDSYIFQQLVFNRVGNYRGKPQERHGVRSLPFTCGDSEGGLIRAFPRGLDVLAVFGSEAALEVLREAGDANYDGYEEQMAQLRAEFASMSPEEWAQNLYYSWLHALRPLLDTEAARRTPFDPAAWARKQLNAALGSWAELRHDTILYAKQSYTVRATGMPMMPELTKGYVEPLPEAFTRLRDLMEQMAVGLRARKLFDEDLGRNLDNFIALLGQLAALAQKEVDGTPLTEEDFQEIWNVGGTLKQIEQLPPQVAERIADAEVDSKMAVIADVHTDTNTGQVLEEGVGRPTRLLALVSVEGQWSLCEGGVFSYYEFKQPMNQRLTDEQWQAMLEGGQTPEWPEWLAGLRGE